MGMIFKIDLFHYIYLFNFYVHAIIVNSYFQMGVRRGRRFFNNFFHNVKFYSDLKITIINLFCSTVNIYHCTYMKVNIVCVVDVLMGMGGEGEVGLGAKHGIFLPPSLISIPHKIPCIPFKIL